AGFDILRREGRAVHAGSIFADFTQGIEVTQQAVAVDRRHGHAPGPGEPCTMLSRTHPRSNISPESRRGPRLTELLVKPERARFHPAGYAPGATSPTNTASAPEYSSSPWRRSARSPRSWRGRPA